MRKSLLAVAIIFQFILVSCSLPEKEEINLNPSIRGAFLEEVNFLVATLDSSTQAFEQSGKLTSDDVLLIKNKISELQAIVPLNGLVQPLILDNIQGQPTDKIAIDKKHDLAKLTSIQTWILCTDVQVLNPWNFGYAVGEKFTINPNPQVSYQNQGPTFDYSKFDAQYRLTFDSYIVYNNSYIGKPDYSTCSNRQILQLKVFSDQTLAVLKAWTEKLELIEQDIKDLDQKPASYPKAFALKKAKQDLMGAFSLIP